MILEHADLRIDPARAADFEAAIEQGVTTVIAHAQGFRGYKVNRSMESPGRYLLMIYWDTLEDHTVGFPPVRGLCAVARHGGAVFPATAPWWSTSSWCASRLEPGLKPRGLQLTSPIMLCW
jgi:hypothetical protein